MKNIFRVVITGIGPISSLGIGKKSFRDGLFYNKSKTTKVECRVDNKRWVTYIKHKVKNFDIADFGIDNQQISSLRDWKEGQKDDDLLSMLAAVKLALDDSKLKYERNNNTVGLIVTHENPGLEQYFSKILETSYEYFFTNKGKNNKIDFYNNMFKKMLKSSYELQTFMPVFHIAKIFGLHGYSLFINNACASGAFVLEEAKKIICSGQSQAVVVVAADFPDVYKYLWFNELGMYSKSGLMKPFSYNADGFIMGDGAVGLVLESMDSAEKRSAHIYGEYLGGAFSQEAWKVTFPSVAEKYYKNTILSVLDVAKVKTNNIDLVVPHGVATSISDKYESKAFEEVFKNSTSKPDFVALKPYFGHNLGGNVLLEIVAILMMMEKQQILQTLNIEGENLITGLPICKAPIRKKVSLVLKTTCAFAGFDSAILLKK